MESESLAFDPAMFGMKSNHGALLPPSKKSKVKNSDTTAEPATDAQNGSSGRGRGRNDGQQRGRGANQRNRGAGRGRGQSRDDDTKAGRPAKVGLTQICTSSANCRLPQRQRDDEPSQDSGWPTAEDRIAKAAEPRAPPKPAGLKAIDGKKYFKPSMLEDPWKDLS